MKVVFYNIIVVNHALQNRPFLSPRLFSILQPLENNDCLRLYRARDFAVSSLPAMKAARANRERHFLSLAGTWRLRLDPKDEGISDNWAGARLRTSDSISLPGTTDLAGFGFALDTKSMRHATPYPPVTRFPGVSEPTRADAQGNLVRRFWYVGPAWYEREIVIPKSWGGRTVTLAIERALWKTEVWLDGRHMGSCDSLVAEHRHVLGVLRPGKHRLTVCVDNRMIHNITTVTHAYGPETQSQWNGMIGAIRLESSPAVSVIGFGHLSRKRPPIAQGGGRDHQ